MGIAHLDVQPAHAVGAVFLIGHPARGRARGRSLAEGKHAGAARFGREEGIGVQADEQIGLHPLGFLHPHMQGHKIIGVTRQEGAHRQVAALGFQHRAIDAVAQAQSDFKDHIFFTGPFGADGARVFAPMARIQRHHNHAIGGRRRGRDRRRRRRRGRGFGFGGDRRLHARMFGQQIAQGVLRCRALGPLGNQGFQGVGHLCGVEVQHQTVVVIGLATFDRWQGENLGLHHLAQIQNQPHGGGGELAHPHPCDEGVIGAHFAHQLSQCRVQLDALDVHRQPWGIGHKQGLRLQGCVRLDGDPGVLCCRPDPYRHNAGASRELGCAQQQHQAARAQGLAACQARACGTVHWLHANKASPQALCAVRVARRTSPSATLS